MKDTNTHQWLARFLGESFRCFLVPIVAAILPRRISAALLTSASRWLWMFPEHSRASAAINQCFEERGVEFEQFALTMLNESTTAWKLLLRRRLHVRQHGAWPSSPAFVAAGGHFGSGLCVLWSLHQAGLQPCFMLRRPSPGWRRTHPVYYWWSVLRFRLIDRLCNGNLIVTGGARRKLQDALESRSVTPVILFDTPIAPGDSDWILPVGKSAITLPEGARRIVTERASSVVFFLPLTNVHEVDAELYLERLNSVGDLIEEFPARFGKALSRSPGEWHFWPMIQPYLHDRT